MRQFIDIGAGLPTQGNVHQIAQEACQDARVVYADNDSTVLRHADDLLSGADSATAVYGDLRQPQRSSITRRCEHSSTSTGRSPSSSWLSSTSSGTKKNPCA